MHCGFQLIVDCRTLMPRQDSICRFREWAVDWEVSDSLTSHRFKALALDRLVHLKARVNRVIPRYTQFRHHCMGNCQPHPSGCHWRDDKSAIEARVNRATCPIQTILSR